MRSFSSSNLVFLVILNVSAWALLREPAKGLAAPAGGCEGVYTIDFTPPFPTSYYSCLNHGCQTSCGTTTVPWPTGGADGAACGCGGQVSGCCHLVVRSTPTGDEMGATGNCSFDQAGCSTGTTCGTKQANDGSTITVTAECSTPPRLPIPIGSLPSPFGN